MAKNSHDSQETDVYLEPMVEFSGSLTAPESEPVIICVSGCAAKPPKG